MASPAVQGEHGVSVDLFEARPTSKIGHIEGDGDTWQEQLAVCEGPSGDGKLLIRSYYQNNRSGKRVWDEPPSGASEVLQATEEMRRMANIQLNELHVVTGQVNDDDYGEEEKTEIEAKGKKKKRGFPWFGKKKNSPKNKTSSSPSKIQYKPGSKLLVKNNNKSSSRRNNHNNRDGEDAQLQEAIARSLAESQGIPYEPGNNLTQPPSNDVDDEELAMAKALSLSAATNNGETEEQLLQRVLEESKQDNNNKKQKAPPGQPFVPYAPKPNPQQQQNPFSPYGVTRGLSNLTMTDSSYDEQDFDRKLPAKNGSGDAADGMLLLLDPPITQSSSSASSYSFGMPAMYESGAIAANSYTPAATSPVYAASSPASTTSSPYASASTASSPYSAAAAPTKKSSPPPAAMFDPYAKDAPPPTVVPKKAPPQPKERSSGSSTSTSGPASLAKMDPSAAASNNHFFGGKRGSSKKVQAKAGLV